MGFKWLIVWKGSDYDWEHCFRGGAPVQHAMYISLFSSFGFNELQDDDAVLSTDSNRTGGGVSQGSFGSAH